tara:strand:+ start:1 stop:1761 length:1761 start_codon:yes stop_codon:yes gene_type:complete
MAKPTLSLDPFNTELMKRGVGGVPMTRKEAVIARSGDIEKPDNPATLIDNLQRGLNSFYQTIQAGGLSQQNQPYKVGESPLSKKSSVVEEQEDIFKPSPEIAIQPRVNFDEIAKAAVKEKKQNQEDFREKEAALTEMQGGLKSQQVVGQGQDNNPNAAGVEESDPTVRAFMAGMDEFINAARGAAPDAPSVKSIEDYKKVFAEATGLDISGKPDKSSALMSLGLALMQNRAGSGFNVGNILRAVGQAGEVALPKLEAAKKEAKATAASAGKFALEMRSADQAKATAAKEKAMQRDDYFIIPKVGGGVSGDIAGILSNKGRLEKLNKYELDRLVNNSEFSDKFTILPGATYATVVEEAMKTPEAQDMYLTKNPITFNLLGEGEDKGADVFNIRLYDADPNKNPNGKPMFGGGDGSMQYRALGLAARDLEKAKQKFLDAMPLVEGTNIFRFSIDKLDAAASAFGVNFREDATPTQKLKLFLTKLQAQNAKEILGEAGKTISDADRALVASIVGDLNAGSTPDELQVKLDGLFNDIIIKKQQKIADAISTLDYYTGRNVSSLLSGGSMSEEDEKERIEGLKKLGINPDE